MSAEPPVHRPRATEVEQHGIDTIPPEHRYSRPLDLFRIQFGEVVDDEGASVHRTRHRPTVGQP